MKNILVTGGAGFIGSNFICYFMEKYPDYHVINIDKLTYAGNLENLEEVESKPNYKFIKGDICNSELVSFIFAEYAITDVIHFAAESHVDNSILNPRAFMETNVLGTFNLLDTAYKSWQNKPFDVRNKYENSRFHQISTDEVYGSLGEEGFFTEKTPYAPNSPYSASKASGDMIVRSYHETYGLNTVITNCSNNYGPKQHKEKLIPTVIRKALAEEQIPIYGDGKNIRDWLYVEDHCRAIDLIFHKGKNGELYNIGADNEQKNIDLTVMICEILDSVKPRSGGKSYKELIEFVQDRPGHDRRYAVDSSKIKKEFSWSSKTSFKDGLQSTIEWYFKEDKLI